MADFARRVAELPVGQWAEVITAVLGPPPVKQPLHIDGTVLEKKPLESQSGPDDVAGAEPGRSVLIDYGQPCAWAGS